MSPDVKFHVWTPDKQHKQNNKENQQEWLMQF
jgi:hypothetical protein